MQIYLKSCHTILGKLSPAREECDFKFTVPAENDTPVTVIIDTNESRAESLYEAEISGELWNVLQNPELDEDSIPECVWNELSQIEECMTNACKRVLSLVKYCLYQASLNERLISSTLTKDS